MNIKEIESASGMARASIRFYEKEGLLAPKRRSFIVPAVRGVAVERSVRHAVFDGYFQQSAVGVGWPCFDAFDRASFSDRFRNHTGKWLFGIRVYGEDGGKLTYGEAFRRTWQVIRQGLGFCVPFLEWYCLYQGWMGYTAEGRVEWDDGTDAAAQQGGIDRGRVCRKL